MPLVHIETNLISAHQFELIQTWIDDDGNNVDEHTYTEKHDDRMYAAMTNLGYACRWLNDSRAYRGAVCIVSDKDGQDKRYSGEHDDLYEAIRSEADYQRNRAKYGLIYGKYLGYLDRIRNLANENEITFTQNASSKLGANRGREQVDEIITEFQQREQLRIKSFSRENLLRLSMKGGKNIVACAVCHVYIEYKQSDEFIPINSWNLTATRTVTIRSNKELVKRFLEKHCLMHGIKK